MREIPPRCPLKFHEDCSQRRIRRGTGPRPGERPFGEPLLFGLKRPLLSDASGDKIDSTGLAASGGLVMLFSCALGISRVRSDVVLAPERRRSYAPPLGSCNGSHGCCTGRMHWTAAEIVQQR